MKNMGHHRRNLVWHLWFIDHAVKEIQFKLWWGLQIGNWLKHIDGTITESSQDPDKARFQSKTKVSQGFNSTVGNLATCGPKTSAYFQRVTQRHNAPGGTVKRKRWTCAPAFPVDLLILSLRLRVCGSKFMSKIRSSQIYIELSMMLPFSTWVSLLVQWHEMEGFEPETQLSLQSRLQRWNFQTQLISKVHQQWENGRQGLDHQRNRSTEDGLQS